MRRMKVRHLRELLFYRPHVLETAATQAMVIASDAINASIPWPAICEEQVKRCGVLCDVVAPMTIPPSRYPARTRAAQSSNSDHCDDKFPAEHLSRPYRAQRAQRLRKIADQASATWSGRYANVCVA